MNQNPSIDVWKEKVAALEKKPRNTEKKLAAVKESEQLYRSVVDNATDAISVLDVETMQRIHLNKAAQKIVGGPGGQAKGIYLYSMVNVEEKDISKDRFKRLINGEPLEPQIYTIVSHRGVTARDFANR